eukprot:CAMPEP_0114326974 /NCGR_PEP_ID=MMETSP0059-20121206/30042_1 /TAXON_ID=36894 /ORGANISM="Pyramimonas parkeae, Strain CCMP726" /LENGTH=241 /DNA_ID=CAMNT_0001456047 /DNA_START=264 /DNA_END=990 /DNA_ORIENTATION=+
MSKPAAEFRAIREEELHDGYTYSGGAYGRRVHYLPPGPAAVRRCGQGIGTWNIAGRVVNSLESTISFGTLESGSWGPPPSMARSMDDGRGVPTWPKMRKKKDAYTKKAQIETAKLALDEASFPTISEMQKGQSRVRRMSQANPGTTGERLPLLASRSFRANTHNAKWQDKKLPGVTVSGPPRRFRDKMMEPVDIHSIERGMPGRVKKITTSTPSTGSQVLADLLQRPCVGGIPDMGAHLLA